MGTVPKRKTGERLNERIVILVWPDFKAQFIEMCKSRGVNPSEYVRELIEADMIKKA
jgi:hypothetical protein